MKTTDAIGPALDWLVAKCEGRTPVAIRSVLSGKLTIRFMRNVGLGPDVFSPSTDWAQGGPIVEREKIGVWWTGEWHAKYDGCKWKDVQDDPFSPLIAAMRCYVASKLGDEVNVPEELA